MKHTIDLVILCSAIFAEQSDIETFNSFVIVLEQLILCSKNVICSIAEAVGASLSIGIEEHSIHVCKLEIWIQIWYISVMLVKDAI